MADLIGDWVLSFFRKASYNHPGESSPGSQVLLKLWSWLPMLKRADLAQFSATLIILLWSTGTEVLRVFGNQIHNTLSFFLAVLAPRTAGS